jgi:DNA-binding cell septation regulator SpoVG
MATKKTNKKEKKTEGVDYKINSQVTLTCFNWGKQQSAKITIANAFVIYARIMENEDGEYYLLYPSYKTKSGEYKKSAFCFDKEIIAEINENLEDFMND